MTTKFSPTQGMKLYFSDDTGSPIVVAKVDQATGVTGLGGKKKKIDLTNQDSVTFTENTGGLIDAGEATFTLIWDWNNTNQIIVQRLTFAAGNHAFYLAASDGTAPPTYDAAANILAPPVTSTTITRSGFGFNGYFSMFQVDAPTDDVIKVQSAVQLSGLITVFKKGATYP